MGFPWRWIFVHALNSNYGKLVAAAFLMWRCLYFGWALRGSHCANDVPEVSNSCDCFRMFSMEVKVRILIWDSLSCRWCTFSLACLREDVIVPRMSSMESHERNGLRCFPFSVAKCRAS
jgi:hypothetical protein